MQEVKNRLTKIFGTDYKVSEWTRGLKVTSLPLIDSTQLEEFLELTKFYPIIRDFTIKRSGKGVTVILEIK